MLGIFKSRIGKDVLSNGLIVSTVDTSDMGHETAIIDDNGVHPVERYPDEESAKEGHIKWVKFAEDAEGKSIIKLGHPDLGIDNEPITLKSN